MLINLTEMENLTCFASFAFRYNKVNGKLNITNRSSYKLQQGTTFIVLKY